MANSRVDFMLYIFSKLTQRFFMFVLSLCLLIVSLNTASASEDFLSLIIDAQDDNAAYAEHALGMMFLQGKDIDPDPNQAFGWFEKAAEQNYLPSIYEMAVMYRDGIGRPADKKKALALFRKAAQKNHAESKDAYTRMLISDKIYKQDPAGAYKWLLAAAKSGDTDAQFVIGDMYQNGLGVKRSIGKARQWYRMAANNGHQRARLRLDGCKNC
jgi:TPR repeat protein